MTEFTCKLAGVPIGVQALCPLTRAICRDYLTQEEPLFTVRITREQLAQEQCIARERIRRDWKDEELEHLCVYRQMAEQLPAYGVMLFHGSALSIDGAGCLFTARSGTGKSTHTRLWRERFGERVQMVNDDKPLLRVEEDRVLVCGSPWNGKHHLGAPIAVPLRAICLLERAEENCIAQIPAAQVLPFLLQQSYRPETPEHLMQTLDLMDRITNLLRFYRLGCNMAPEAAEISYEGMKEAFL